MVCRPGDRREGLVPSNHLKYVRSAESETRQQHGENWKAAMVLHNYSAGDRAEISVHTGELVFFDTNDCDHDGYDDGWVMAARAAAPDDIGLVPANYICADSENDNHASSAHRIDES
jgi:hypothetical protein